RVVCAGVVVAGDECQRVDAVAGVNGEQRVERGHASIKSNRAGGRGGPIVPNGGAARISSVIGLAGLLGGIGIVSVDGAGAAANGGGGGKVIIPRRDTSTQRRYDARDGSSTVVDHDLIVTQVGGLQ